MIHIGDKRIFTVRIILILYLTLHFYRVMTISLKYSCHRYRNSISLSNIVTLSMVLNDTII